MNSLNRFGRRERSTVFSPPAAAGSTMRPPDISAPLRSVVTRYRPPDRRRNDSRIRRSVERSAPVSRRTAATANWDSVRGNPRATSASDACASGAVGTSIAPPPSCAKFTEPFFSRSGSSRAIRWASFFPIPGTRVKAAASSRAHAARTPGTARTDSIAMADFGPTPLTPIVARKISRSVSVEKPYRSAPPSRKCRWVRRMQLSPSEGRSLRVASETRARNPIPAHSSTTKSFPPPARRPRRWSIIARMIPRGAGQNPSEVPGYGAAESHGEGVGGVGGDRIADAEEAGDHPGDLLLRGTAVPRRRHLDLLGAVFVDRNVVNAAGDDRGDARMAKLEGGRGVFREEDLLDRGLRGPLEEDQVGECAMDPEETVGEGRLAFEPDHAPRHGGNDIPPDVDDPVPGPQ